MTDFRPIIEARRDGRRQDQADLERIAKGAANGSIPDYQLAAWLMAAYLNPLSEEETAQLTVAMAQSGERLNLSSLPKPWIDKHSTGGVGDKTSIVALPLLAACGFTVVKMSGPGLGITGGTVDKLSSIPGFRMALTPKEMISQAREIGIAITGQTADLAPADKVIYALRDATATVRNIPLIVSSILSKKLAGGAEIVVLDVKCGSGAFMKTLPEAQKLARWLQEIGTRCGLKIKTAITDMDQPLGSAVGNALEVREALQVLTRPIESLPAPTRRLRDLCVHLTLEALQLVQRGEQQTPGSDSDWKQLAEKQLNEVLASGRARLKVQQWIAAQGGPRTIEETLASLPTASVQTQICSRQSGWVKAIPADIVGDVVVQLGGGRKSKADQIDPSVGIEVHQTVGDRVEEGQPVLTVHANSDQSAESAVEKLNTAYEISPQPIHARPLFL